MLGMRQTDTKLDPEHNICLLVVGCLDTYPASLSSLVESSMPQSIGSSMACTSLPLPSLNSPCAGNLYFHL